MTDEHYDFKLAFDKVLDKGSYERANLSNTEKQCIHDTLLKYKVKNVTLLGAWNFVIFKYTGLFSEIYKLDNHWLKRFNPNQNGTIYSILENHTPAKHKPHAYTTFPTILTCLFDGINHALATLNDDVAHNTECINDICKPITPNASMTFAKTRHNALSNSRAKFNTKPLKFRLSKDDFKRWKSALTHISSARQFLLRHQNHLAQLVQHSTLTN